MTPRTPSPALEVHPQERMGQTLDNIVEGLRNHIREKAEASEVPMTSAAWRRALLDWADMRRDSKRYPPGWIQGLHEAVQDFSDGQIRDLIETLLQGRAR